MPTTGITPIFSYREKIMQASRSLRLIGMSSVLIVCVSCESVSRQFDRLVRFIDGQDRVEMEGSTVEVTPLVPGTADVFDPAFEDAEESILVGDTESVSIEQKSAEQMPNDQLPNEQVSSEKNSSEPNTSQAENLPAANNPPPALPKVSALPAPIPMVRVPTTNVGQNASETKPQSQVSESTTMPETSLVSFSGKVLVEIDAKDKSEFTNRSLIRLIPLYGENNSATPPISSTDTPVAQSKSVDHIVDMKDKTYFPRYMTASKNDTVVFTNSDKIRHNVFSRSGKNAFDLGTYAGGKKRGVTFKEAGIIKIYCNIHPTMASFISVIDEGYSTVSDLSGNFSFSDVPVGEYTVEAWNIRGSVAMSVDLNPQSNENVTLLIDVLDPEFTEHSNKFGEKYSDKPGLFGDEFY